MNPDVTWLLTCEHAGNELPTRFRHLFAGNEEILHTHEGWDPGAWAVAQHLASALKLPVYSCHTTRLLVEVNRSIGHPQLFSAFSHLLPESEKQLLVDSVYHSYRAPVQHAIEETEGPVAHLSIHSFTPVLGGKVRDLDVGILFDPDRFREMELSQRLKGELGAMLPDFKIDFNEPYRGTDDGFTTYLRTKFPDERYRGIELEVNQLMIDTEKMATLMRALEAVLLKV